MGTPPSAGVGWNNPGGELLAVTLPRSNRYSEGTRASSHVFSASMNESGQVPYEKVVEHAFAV